MYIRFPEARIEAQHKHNMEWAVFLTNELPTSFHHIFFPLGRYSLFLFSLISSATKNAYRHKHIWWEAENNMRTCRWMKKVNTFFESLFLYCSFCRFNFLHNYMLNLWVLKKIPQPVLTGRRWPPAPRSGEGGPRSPSTAVTDRLLVPAQALWASLRIHTQKYQWYTYCLDSGRATSHGYTVASSLRLPLQ